MHFNRSIVITVILAVSMWWTVSMFAAPFMVAPGTIVNLDGRANTIDYAPLWNSIHPYPRVIYYMGDINCHQLSSRTVYLNGNEMPVCARDVSIFVFFNVGLVAALLTMPSPGISTGVLNLFPEKFRKSVSRYKRGPALFAIIFFALLLLPTAVDGFAQMLTPYESTNLVRLLTGAPCGFASGFYLGVMITSAGEIDRIRKRLRDELKRELGKELKSESGTGILQKQKNGKTKDEKMNEEE
jgi:uncharacterized membrane protein